MGAIFHWRDYLLMGLGLTICACVFDDGCQREQKLKARAEVSTLTERVTSYERALADEKLATKGALDAAAAWQASATGDAARFQAAIQDLTHQLESYRADLSKCTTPDAVLDQMGGMFP